MSCVTFLEITLAKREQGKFELEMDMYKLMIRCDNYIVTNSNQLLLMGFDTPGIKQVEPQRQRIKRRTWSLTLRLLMSYIYGAPSKARNANVIYIWTYVWQRWNRLFLFAAQCFNTAHCTTAQCFNTLPASWQSVYTQMWHRKPLCIDSVLKHCAANRKRLFQGCQT